MCVQACRRAKVTETLIGHAVLTRCATLQSQLQRIEKDPTMGDETARFVAKAARKRNGHTMAASTGEHQVAWHAQHGHAI